MKIENTKKNDNSEGRNIEDKKNVRNNEKKEIVNKNEAQVSTIEELKDTNDPRFIRNKLNELYETKTMEIYDENSNPIVRYPISDAAELMQNIKNGVVIITGGVISQRFIDISYSMGIKSIYGMKMGHITKKPDDIRVVTWEHI